MIPDNLYQLSEFELSALLRDLDRIEKKVICLRFGIPAVDRGQPLTLQGVSDALGMTREQVRATEIKAMNKLGWIKILS